MSKPSFPRRLRPAVVIVAVAGLLVSLGAVPAAGKEFLQATLDAPIAFDSPPGAILLVGVTVMAPDGANGEMVPVIGSPIALILTGRSGATTRAAAEGTETDGYYLFHLEVPAGGPRRLEVGMHGSGPDGPVDLPITLTTDPFTFGPIREGTAQIAPPVDGSRSGAAGVASIPPLEPAAPVAAPAAAPAVDLAVVPVAPAPPDSVPGWVVPALVALGVALAVAALAALVARGRRRPDDPDRLPGAARGG